MSIFTANLHHRKAKCLLVLQDFKKKKGKTCVAPTVRHVTKLNTLFVEKATAKDH